MCAKWVPKLWMLSEKSKNFWQNKVSEIRGSEIRVSEIRVSKIRISSNHRELHGAIFFLETNVHWLWAQFDNCLLSWCKHSTALGSMQFTPGSQCRITHDTCRLWTIFTRSPGRWSDSTCSLWPSPTVIERRTSAPCSTRLTTMRETRSKRSKSSLVSCRVYFAHGRRTRTRTHTRTHTHTSTM